MQSDCMIVQVAYILGSIRSDCISTDCTSRLYYTPYFFSYFIGKKNYVRFFFGVSFHFIEEKKIFHDLLDLFCSCTMYIVQCTWCTHNIVFGSLIKYINF